VSAATKKNSPLTSGTSPTGARAAQRSILAEGELAAVGGGDTLCGAQRPQPGQPLGVDDQARDRSDRSACRRVDGLA
jgi:hypothetical protein